MRLWSTCPDRGRVLGALLLALTAVGPSVARETAAAAGQGEPTANWPCAGAPTRQAPGAGVALYVLRSIGPQPESDQQPIWGTTRQGAAQRASVDSMPARGPSWRRTTTRASVSLREQEATASRAWTTRRWGADIRAP